MYKKLGKNPTYHAIDTYQISLYADTKTLNLITGTEIKNNKTEEKMKILSNIHYVMKANNLNDYEIEKMISFTYYLLNNLQNFHWKNSDQKKLLSFLINILYELKKRKIEDFYLLNDLFFQSNILKFFHYHSNQSYKDIDQGTLGLLRSEFYKNECRKLSY